MSNEELVQRIQAGERDRLMDLWAQVRGLVYDMARRRIWVTDGLGGVTLDDLMQAGFLGFLEATETYKQDKGTLFSTWLVYHIKREFNQAQGRRRNPLDRAVSLETPLTDREDDPITLEDTLPDPEAEEAVEEVGQWDGLYRALETLPEAQRAAVRRRYWQEQQVDRKLLHAALRALRHPSVSRSLRDCL